MGTTTFAVGDMQVTALSDGYAKSPLDSFPGADFAEHRDLVDADGTMHLPIGSFVVRSRDVTVLIDAGLGALTLPESPDAFHAGRLAGELEAAGFTPGEIDIVACTHLHLDHSGWLADGGGFFANATLRFGAADWPEFVDTAEPSYLVPEALRDGLRAMADAGRVDPIDHDGESIAPGINALATPGHTRGHQAYVLSSGADRVIILGDSIVCPLQITGPEWSVVTETDPRLGQATREKILREVEGTATRVTGPHFPGLLAGRVLRGEGRRRFVYS